MNDRLVTIGADAATLSSASENVATGAWSDWVGMAASIGCAVHCAAMPFVIAYLPAFGLSFLADEAFHKWMALACFVIALMAFIPGFRKHGRLTPMATACAGLVLISVAAFGLAGKCCPSCASKPAEDAARHATSASDVACIDEGCAVCAAESETTETSSVKTPRDGLAASTQTPPWLAAMAPWMTPVGGLILVSAHLLNRRYGCLCGCCDNGNPKRAAA